MSFKGFMFCTPMTTLYRIEHDDSSHAFDTVCTRHEGPSTTPPSNAAAGYSHVPPSSPGLNANGESSGNVTSYSTRAREASLCPEPSRLLLLLVVLLLFRVGNERDGYHQAGPGGLREPRHVMTTNS